LIPAAIDQDPYFRMTRDVAHRLKYMKPASIYASFFPALAGKKKKMSSSAGAPKSVLLTDDKKSIKDKINKHALSGGQQTLELQRELGADLDIDVPVAWLEFFLEDDDELEEIKKEYKAGRKTTGEVKARLIEVITEFIMDFQAKRAKVTDADVELFKSIRQINPYPAAWKDELEKRAAERRAQEDAKQKAKE